MVLLSAVTCGPLVMVGKISTNRPSGEMCQDRKETGQGGGGVSAEEWVGLLQ